MPNFLVAGDANIFRPLPKIQLSVCLRNLSQKTLRLVNSDDIIYSNIFSFCFVKYYQRHIFKFLWEDGKVSILGLD